MPTRRPGSVTAAGILAIIYGSFFTICGLCGLIGQAAQGAMGGNMMAGNDPNMAQMQKQLQEAVANELPMNQAIEIGSAIVSLGVAVVLLIAGIGILKLLPWSRTLAVVGCLIAMAFTAFQMTYQIAFVMPVTSRVLEVALPAMIPKAAGPNQQPNFQPADAMKFMKTFVNVMFVVFAIFFVLRIVYLIIIVALLSRRQARAAFADQGQTDWDGPVRDEQQSHAYDDDPDWNRPPSP